jgi:hypothetical protein
MGHDPDLVRQLVGRLPYDAACQLFREIGLPGGSGERVHSVRCVLLEKLNHSRRAHDRRLFTALFEPLLCRDERFLDPQFAPPGYLHRLDTGGLWHALSQDHFPDLARTIKERLDRLATETPVSQVLAGTEGQALSLQVRRAAVAVLDRNLAGPGSGRTLLNRINTWRQENAGRGRLPAALRPLVRDDLLLARAVLVMPPELAGMIRDLIGCADRLDRLDQVMNTCTLAAGEDARLAQLPGLIPLVLMHEYRDYRTAVYVLRNARAQSALPVLDALERHLKRTCREFCEALGETVGLGGVLSGPLLVSRTNRNRVNTELESLRQLLGLHADFNLSRNQRIGTASREHLDQMLRMVEDRALPILLERVIAASGSALRPSSDHDDLLWLLDVIRTWRDMLREQIESGSRFTAWRDNLLGFLQENYRAALTSRNYYDAGQRWDHILRIDALTAKLGRDLADWLRPLDHAMVRVAIERLEGTAGIPSRAFALIGIVAGLAETELARIKYWKDPVLLRLTELYRSRSGGQPG